MDAQSYQSAKYVSRGGRGAEKERRKEQLNEHEQQQQAPNPSLNNTHNQSPTPPSPRKRADSHQQPTSPPSPSPHQAIVSAHLRSSYDYERPRRYSCTADTGHVGRLSGNFNAPTVIEVERERERRKSLKGVGVERIRRKVGGWVRT